MASYNLSNMDKIIYNGTSLDKVIYNGTVVWESVKVISLGSGTSFNVKNYYSDYAKLTVDDFYIKRSADFSETNWTAKTVYQDRSSGDAQSYLYKSYDASTGVLTAYTKYKYYYADSNGSGPKNYDKNLNVNVSLITKEPISLGTAQSFDVKNYYSDYAKLTADNFYVRQITPFKETGWTAKWAYEDRSTGVAKSELVKTYNASTGILTCYLHYVWDYKDSNGTSPQSFDEKQNVSVFLCDK